MDMQGIHAITMWASSEDMHQPWKPCKEHAPSEKAVGDVANSRRHVPNDISDDSDHGASHNKKEAGSVASAREVLQQIQSAQVAGCHVARRRLYL